ncbi:hypothetical protein ACQEVC_05655 [Plantactinospora sp. CA-294935]
MRPATADGAARGNSAAASELDAELCRLPRVSRVVLPPEMRD